MTDTIFPINITKNGTFTLPARLKQNLGIVDKFFIFVKDEVVYIKKLVMTLEQAFGSVESLNKTALELKKILEDEKTHKYQNL